MFFSFAAFKLYSLRLCLVLFLWCLTGLEGEGRTGRSLGNC